VRSCAIVFLIAAFGAAIFGFSGVAGAAFPWSLASLAALVALGVGFGLSLRGRPGGGSSLRARTAALEPTRHDSGNSAVGMESVETE